MLPIILPVSIPEWFVNYGDKKYFDPGNKEGQKFVVNVVRDIVKRYDVDAIHMDDYFYPYRIPGKEFPDEASYKRSGTKLNKDDWRRSNTDSIIEAISIAIKRKKDFAGLVFLLSVFGAIKIKIPKEAVIARVDKPIMMISMQIFYYGLQKGWIDYVTPQLYFHIGHPKVDYAKMLDWWSRNSYGRHVYIGHGIYRASAKEKDWNNPKELPRPDKIITSLSKCTGQYLFQQQIL